MSPLFMGHGRADSVHYQLGPGKVLKAVVDGFLENHRAINYAELIEKMLESFKVMGCRGNVSHKASYATFLIWADSKTTWGLTTRNKENVFHQRCDGLLNGDIQAAEYNENMMGRLHLGLSTRELIRA
ncbi:hypothetical protein KQX54_001635 [Cotesia glomerata]|uniref:Uncharacterized protein n=1 Tax=Cotesia glomerata TaxID=32391 RepID=A0AAV7IZ28_COTGL|nr:hypothetical protein KQX54_001635 [Cotesia glomerata]